MIPADRALLCMVEVGSLKWCAATSILRGFLADISKACPRKCPHYSVQGVAGGVVRPFRLLAEEAGRTNASCLHLAGHLERKSSARCNTHLARSLRRSLRGASAGTG